jgi:hypothetical protein
MISCAPKSTTRQRVTRKRLASDNHLAYQRAKPTDEPDIQQHS